jgi:hypothetical protein
MSNTAVAPSVRAAVFTVVCTLLALGAHLPMAAGGVPLPAIAVGAGLVFGVARVAAGGERGLAAISGLVGACQVGLHLVFDAARSSTASMTAVSSTSSPFPTSSISMSDMPSMHDPLAALSMAQMAPMGPAGAVENAAGSHAGAAPMGLSAGMTLAHVLAALVAAWWLRRGEAAAFACARWAGALVRANWRALAWLLATPAADVAPSRTLAPCGADPPQGLHSGLIRFSVIRRGPPTVPAV